MATAPPTAQLSDMAASLRRRWPVVVASAGVGLVLGAFVSVLVPDRYEATTAVSVNPIDVDAVGSSTDASRSVSMPTEAGVATSARVAAAAARDLAPRESLTAEQVADATTVESTDGSLILDIRFSGSSAQQAGAGADAVAKAYLSTRRSEATTAIERLVTTTQEQVAAVQAASADPANAGPISQRSLGVQADALGATLARLGATTVDPGQVVGDAGSSTHRSTPGALSLGVAGLFLGLLAGVPIAVLRREDDSDIGGVDTLYAIGDQLVLDGTQDAHRADTWDIAAFMLKIPEDIGIEDPFLIMVDAEEGPGRSTTSGQELVDALSRRGQTARFVDAGLINEGKISRGWPTDAKRETWAGEVIVIDTTRLTSDAHKVALATRSDSVLLARTTADDASALRRLTGLLRSENVRIALTALFPPRPEMVPLQR